MFLDVFGDVAYKQIDERIITFIVVCVVGWRSGGSWVLRVVIMRLRRRMTSDIVRVIKTVVRAIMFITHVTFVVATVICTVVGRTGGTWLTIILARVSMTA